MTYKAQQFIEKNADRLHRDLVSLMSKSSNPLAAELFADAPTDTEKTRRPPSLSAQFKKQVRCGPDSRVSPLRWKLFEVALRVWDWGGGRGSIVDGVWLSGMAKSTPRSQVRFVRSFHPSPRNYTCMHIFFLGGGEGDWSPLSPAGRWVSYWLGT